MNKYIFLALAAMASATYVSADNRQAIHALLFPDEGEQVRGSPGASEEEGGADVELLLEKADRLAELQHYSMQDFRNSSDDIGDFISQLQQTNARVSAQEGQEVVDAINTFKGIMQQKLAAERGR